MSNADVREICTQIVDEANAVIAYTNSIEMAESEKTKAIFEEIRQDELGHLQKHIVALTEVLSGVEPTEAEKMDEEVEEEGGEDE